MIDFDVKNDNNRLNMFDIAKLASRYFKAKFKHNLFVSELNIK